MTGAVAAELPGGRLHLQHGPIDLVIAAEGRDVAAAYAAAARRFETVLTELVAELPLLRSEVSDRRPDGAVARRMHAAVRPLAHLGYVTPMAAVAGAVADEILAAMTAAAPLAKAHVNNGGDIAVHLAPGTESAAAVMTPAGRDLGRLRLTAGDGIGGIATSGQGGRSHSLGIAEAVTVLARSAAAADAAATLIANAVDLPDHPGVRREAARALDPDSDLGDRPVVTRVGPLTEAEADRALAAGDARAETLRRAGRIAAALLALRGQSRVVGRFPGDSAGIPAMVALDDA